uniref:serine--tRNA ligase n=1 Tax=Cacopsylla melanoneura TaxID=428564 RepID=A0A8D8MDB7_9HEMI
MKPKLIQTLCQQINHQLYRMQSKYYHHSVGNLLKEFDSYKTCNKIQEPSLNLDDLLNTENRDKVEQNVKLRKTHVNLNEIYTLHEKYQLTKDESVRKDLLEKSMHIPNTTHPDAPKNEDFEVIRHTNEKKSFDFKPKSFLNLMNKHGYCRTDNLSHCLGNRSYYFDADLCLLENAVIQYVFNKLIGLNFQLITVPDILSEDVVKRCGMNTRGERSQIYHLEPDYYGQGWCLSGTAEMGIARFLMNQTIPQSQLPMRIAAMSRCYRAEISDVADEKGVYRVHCFTKIEMFGVTLPEESEKHLNSLLQFEQDLFAELGLHIRTLNMGANELGAQAHRKYDVEAWMPGRKKWGELSSCSDCTDYQAQRLNIRTDNGRFVHTLNGTACAIPRLLMALVETHQNEDGTINIPECLQSFMFNKKLIGEDKGVTLVRVKSSVSKPMKKQQAKAALSKVKAEG